MQHALQTEELSIPCHVVCNADARVDAATNLNNRKMISGGIASFSLDFLFLKRRKAYRDIKEWVSIDVGRCILARYTDEEKYIGR